MARQAMPTITAAVNEKIVRRDMTGLLPKFLWSPD
jgi:hypothetical protein